MDTLSIIVIFIALSALASLGLILKLILYFSSFSNELKFKKKWHDFWKKVDDLIFGDDI